MLLVDPYSAVSNNIFPPYCMPTVFLQVRYRDMVAFRTKNCVAEQEIKSWSLTRCKLQTSQILLWRVGTTLSDHFQCPCNPINTFQGEVPAFIDSSFFGMFVLGVPSGVASPQIWSGEMFW